MKLLDRHIALHFDFPSLILISIIIFISGYLIQEISSNLFNKYIVYLSISLIIFIVLFLLPIRKMLWLIPIIYWSNITYIILVALLGVSKLGAKRWLYLPFGFTYQPSETMKTSLVLMLAYIINKNSATIKNSDTYPFKEFIKLSIYILIPFALILKQPDLGTAVIILIIGGSILFLLKTDWKIWLVIIVLIASVSPSLYEHLKDYQKARITGFLDKNKTYQVRQSLIAIGSGGLYGKKENNATQTHMNFLPIASSDFIFSYIGERFGFIGIIGVMTIYMLLILHLFFMFFNPKFDYLIRTVALGYSVMFFIYTSVNIAMTIGLAPVVGLPLPMISYGGTSFISFIVLFAVLQNLLSFRFNMLYKNNNFTKYKYNK